MSEPREGFISEVAPYTSVAAGLRIAEAAIEYVAARLAMGEAKDDELAMIVRLDDAWANLLEAYDAEQPE